MSAETPVTAGLTTGPTPGVPSPRLSGAPAVPGFAMLDQLGKGAHSAVYRVRREQDQAEYALKIVDLVKLDPSAELIAFRREAALLAAIDHPGLSRIHEVGEADGRPYLVMDLIQGRSLAEVLTGGPMPPDRVVRLGIDIIGPLAAVHRRDLVHRDIKPANIMIRTDGTARLIDFGLTGRGDEEGSDSVAGTIAYSPPEQSGTLNRPVDNRSDLYSLGIVLFQCLAGELPFRAADVGELLRLHAVAPAPDLREIVPGVPPGLAEIVATLLSKDPDDRYQMGEHLAGHLRALASDPRFRPGSAERFRPPDAGQPLVGRTHELARLRERWELARRGEGGVCLVRGMAGSGKSRLVDEFVAGVRNNCVLTGRGAPDEPVPFSPLRAALEIYLDGVERLPADRRASALGLVRTAADGTADLLAGLGARLARAVGASAPPGRPDQDQFAQAVVEFLIRLATASGGLLLVVDDVQWIDPGTSAVLHRLADEIHDVPVLTVLVGRDESDAPGETGALTGFAAVADLDLPLHPLDDEDVRRQVESLVPGLGSITQLSRLLAVRSNGNPFVVQEYVRAVVDAGLLRPSWGTWILDVEELDDLDLPQDAVGLVLTRVTGLSESVRQFLVTAAAIGRRFRPEVIAAVHEVGVDAVVADLTEPVNRGLLEPMPGGAFGFVHTRIREALLDDLGREERADRHGRIAEALDARSAMTGWSPEHTYAVASQYIQAAGGRGVVNPARAFIACRTAGRLALDHHSAAEAVGFLTYAVSLPGTRDQVQEAELFLLLGTALLQAGRLPEAQPWLDRALAAETDPLARAEILTLIAEVHRSRWDADLAMTAVDRGLAEIGGSIPGNGLVAAMTSLAILFKAWFVENTGIGTRGAERHRRRYRALIGLHEVGVYIGIIDLRPSRALLHTVRLTYCGNRLGAGREYALGQALLGVAYSMGGLHRAARRAFNRSLADSSHEIPSVSAILDHHIGITRYMTGRDNGQALAATLQDRGRWLDLGSYLDGCGILHGEAAARGRSADAEYWLARGRSRLGAHDGLRAFSVSAAVTHALRGEAADAGEELRRLGGLADGHSPRGLSLVRLQATLTILNEQGELGAPFEEAVAEIEALGIHRGRPVRSQQGIPLQIALGRLAQLRWADPTSRAARLTAARAAVERLPAKLTSDVLNARAVLARADLLVMEGRAGEALVMLTELPIYYSPDAPLPAMETRLVRARVLVALGAPEEARRQARAAAKIAADQGWPHRMRAVSSEFGIPPVEPGWISLPGRPHPAGATSGERQRLQALQEVSAAASRVLEPLALARITLDETLRILNADRAFLFLTEDSVLVPYLGRDAGDDDVLELTGYSTTLVERVRDTARPLVVTGTEEGAALGAQSVVLHGLRSIMVAPVLLEGRLLGVVYLDSQVAKGIFTADDVSLLSALTNHIATALETARAAQLEVRMQTAQRQRDVAVMLRSTLEEFSETLDPQQVVWRMLSAAPRAIGCEAAWMISTRFDQPDGIGNLLAPGTDGELLRRTLTLDPQTRRLVELPAPIVGGPGDVPVVLADELARATSWIALPLLAHLAGAAVVIMASYQEGADLSSEVEVAAALCVQCVAAYEKAFLFSKVQELAVVDDLTGIANRRRFFEVAGRDFVTARRHGREVTALMVDIDHFKLVNDEFGHPAGDDVIRVVAQRLAAGVRATDVLARYGGEEFVLLLPDAGLDNELPDRLRASIGDEPLETRCGPVTVTVSVGQANLSPDDDDLEALLSRADQALYEAKRSGRNRVCIAPATA